MPMRFRQLGKKIARAEKRLVWLNRTLEEAQAHIATVTSFVLQKVDEEGLNGFNPQARPYQGGESEPCSEDEAGEIRDDLLVEEPSSAESTEDVATTGKRRSAIHELIHREEAARAGQGRRGRQ